MNNGTETLKSLDDIQTEIDNEYEKFAKRDFNFKLKYHNIIKPLLVRRDELVSNAPEIASTYWGCAFLNYELGVEILPVDDNGNVVADWMKKLQVDYIEGYIYEVQIKLNENEFVCNESLSKRIYLEGREVDTTEVGWKSNKRHPIFAFFESESEDFEIFDILYELYVNSAFYFLVSD